jgi:3-isopropylmalate dehydratase small subunit
MLFAIVAADSNAKVQVDLAAQKLTLPGGRGAAFPVDAFSQQCPTRQGSLNTLA